MMPLGEGIKSLRTEAGLSQAELAEYVVGDGRQTRRNEDGRFSACLGALERTAEALNVSLGHLVFDDIAGRQLHVPESILGDRLGVIAEPNDDDRAPLPNAIGSLVKKIGVRTVAGGVS